MQCGTPQTDSRPERQRDPVPTKNDDGMMRRATDGRAGGAGGKTSLHGMALSPLDLPLWLRPDSRRDRVDGDY